MNKVVKKEMMFAGRKLSLETGKLAFMANMAVLARWGDTVIFATATSSAPKGETDGIPLTCKYDEKLYAGGLIKSSRWVKREGSPTDQAIIAGRLIDHAVRPLFPKDFQDETTVTTMVMSLDKDADPEVLAMIAASAALHASDIPWNGPMVTSRVATKPEGSFVLNPTEEELEHSTLDLVVSLRKGKFLAMEALANNVPEQTIVDAVNFVDANTKELSTFLEDFAKEVGKEKYTYVSKAVPQEVINDVKNVLGQRVKDLMKRNLEKTQLSTEREFLLNELYTAFEGKYTKSDMQKAFVKIETDVLRKLVLEEGIRNDGRGIDELRNISGELGILPRTHGSAVFSRGVTQGLTVVTLGSPSLEQIVQSMYGEATKRYMHHYNMPEYASGETARGRGGSPKAREIGHGMLAEKALYAVLPEKEIFPYTIRLVTEILSSSGSTSMAATCGSSLSLMDAGVPIREHVAGIAIGLIADEEETKYVPITDIAYLEDAYGFMDFKMTGTRTGVTAIQVDLKLQGVPVSLLPKIVEQSRQARMKILDVMESIISAPRASVSEFAPKMITVKVKPEQVGLVIGSGGKTIKDIEAKTGATLGIDDDGTVAISAPTAEGMEKARLMVEGLTKQVEPGEVYEGTVKRVTDFGAFVEILPGKEGLVHVSELSHGYTSNVRDVVNEGDTVKVKVIEIDQMGRINLSKKALEEKPEGMEEDMGGRREPFGDRGGDRGGDRRGGDRRGGREGGRGGFGGGHRPGGPSGRSHRPFQDRPSRY